MAQNHSSLSLKTIAIDNGLIIIIINPNIVHHHDPQILSMLNKCFHVSVHDQGISTVLGFHLLLHRNSPLDVLHQ